MHLLGISGSLRAQSNNTILLQTAQELCPSSANLRLEPSIGTLPLFNPDIAEESSDVVMAFVDRVRSSDGMVISSPVYAGGYPGALKNALDWLVATDAFVEKPFMLLRASSRMIEVEASLIKVLTTMSGIHIEAASSTINLLGRQTDVAQIIADELCAETIRSSVDTFIGAIVDK